MTTTILRTGLLAAIAVTICGSAPAMAQDRAMEHHRMHRAMRHEMHREMRHRMMRHEMHREMRHRMHHHDM